MTREFLKNIKSENRLDKIRLIMTNDDVIGGQPTDDESFTSNTPFLDIACTMKFAIAAASTADGKAVAAQKTADEAKLAASNADKKAAGAQTSANAAKTAAATADGKAVAAQKAADEAKTAAENADKKAAGAQTSANAAKTAAATADGKAVAAQKTADTSQTKANQVPNPIKDQFLIGNTATGYKLITKEELIQLLAIPSAVKVVNETGDSTTSAISQKAFTDLSLGIEQKWVNVTSQRAKGTTYTNDTDKPIFISVTGRETTLSLDINDERIVTGGGSSNYISAIIQQGERYKITASGNFEGWGELR